MYFSEGDLRGESVTTNIVGYRPNGIVRDRRYSTTYTNCSSFCGPGLVGMRDHIVLVVFFNIFESSVPYKLITQLYNMPYSHEK